MAEDFTKIDPNTLPDDLKGLYKSMQADYTRKTQEVASVKEELSKKEQTWMKELQDFGKVKQEVEQWRAYYKQLQDETAAAEKDIKDDDTNTDPVARTIDALKADIEAIKSQFGSVGQSVKDMGSRVTNMFSFQSQLNDLVSKDPEIERDKLLKHAMDKNMYDLEVAYKDLYHDRLVDREVEKRLAERMKEVRTSGIMQHSTGNIVRRAEGTPKTFAEATEQVLKHRAAEGTLA